MWIRFVSAKKKPTPVAKKMLIFSLPTKATTKELRITLSLFVVVVCHICLTIPQVSNLLYSVYNSVVKVVEFHSEVIVNLNSFLHPNEPPQRIFWYLVRKLEADLSHLTFSVFKVNILAKNQRNNSENYFCIRILD